MSLTAFCLAFASLGCAADHGPCCSPVTLSANQVRRSDLKALKPIGAGQFGQVYLTEQSVAAGDGDGGGGSIKRTLDPVRLAPLAAQS